MESKNVGALIFDEVKVISRLLWNSRSQTVIELCMTHQQQSSLADIYQVLNAKETVQQTSYICNFSGEISQVTYAIEVNTQLC